MIGALLALAAQTAAHAASQPALTAQDFAFNFDQPAFFEIVHQVQAGGIDRGSTADATTSRNGVDDPRRVDDWREFVERPGDFRGACVRIRGVLARNKDPFTFAKHPDLGSLTQLELTGAQPGLAATVVCTEDVGDLAIGDTLEFAARFVMVRSYYTDSGRVAHAPLFVASGPISSAHAAPRIDSAASRHLPWIGAAFVLALAAFWVILRRAAKAPIRGGDELRSHVRLPPSPPTGWSDVPLDVLYSDPGPMAPDPTDRENERGADRSREGKER